MDMKLFTDGGITEVTRIEGLGYTFATIGQSTLFLTDEMLDALLADRNREGKQEYEIVHTSGYKEHVLDTFWSVDQASAEREAAERMRSDEMGDVDYVVRVKS